MYIQWCLKGIVGRNSPSDRRGLLEQEAIDIIDQRTGILSNWWRQRGSITPPEIEAVLTEANLDRHLHDYDRFGPETPFISLAAGCVERSTWYRRNWVHSALDTALSFATEDWTRPGAVYYCWTPVGLNRAVESEAVAESVRDLNVYHRWSPWQLEGEITAKINIPANQIQKVEWWDPTRSRRNPVRIYENRIFMSPERLTTLRDFF